MSETLLNLEAVKRKVSLGHTSIYKLMGMGEFPQPVRISDDSPAVRWLESEVDAWIQSRADLRMERMREAKPEKSKSPLESGASGIDWRRESPRLYVRTVPQASAHAANSLENQRAASASFRCYPLESLSRAGKRTRNETQSAHSQIRSKRPSGTSCRWRRIIPLRQRYRREVLGIQISAQAQAA